MLGMRELSNITSSPDHTLSIGMQKSGPELVSYPDPSVLFCSFLCVFGERKQAEGKLDPTFLSKGYCNWKKATGGVRCH